MRRLLLVLLVATGCVDDAVSPVAAFETPTGLAVAGTARDRLFISNSAQDTVQVMNLGEDLTDIEFVFGPSTRVPLRIPAGLGPTDLAATADRRWVIVLDRVSESLRAIDADRLLLARDAEGAVVQMPLGKSGVRPSGMVASPSECGPECVGRVYVSLAGAGTIVGVDVIVEAEMLRFRSSSVLPVGGEPAGIAVRGDGRVLFASDASSAELIRVDLETGVFERRDLGGVGGPVAVSSDGEAVIVGRPEERDLVVFRDADGPGLTPNDNNPMWAPIPICTWRCDDPDPDVCADAHPADRAMCETDDGLVAVAGQDYDAIYIGEVPTHIVTLGAGAGTPALSTACGEDATPREYAEFAAVAVLDGSVMYLGLKPTEDAPLAPELVSTTFCLSPTVEAITVGADGTENDVRLDDYLSPCPESPDGRYRFQCVRDEPGSNAGIVVSPGNTGNKIWAVAWEGVLFDRTSETGLRPGAGSLVEVPVEGSSCTTDGQCAADARCDGARCVRTFFSDLAEALHERGIRPCVTAAGEACAPDTDPADITHWGDRLVITSAPAADCPLAACDDASAIDWRVFERRIISVEPFGDVSRMQLDRPIPPECFREGGAIEYRIRLGSQYTLAAGGESGFERVGLGQRIGPSGDVGRSRHEMFGFPARDSRPELAACERYEEDGQVACESVDDQPGDATCVSVMDDVLARSETLQLVVDEYFRIFRSGRALDLNRQPSGTAGRIPGAMIVSFVGAAEPVIFVSYAGTNGVLGTVPFDVIGTFDTARRYTLLR